MTTFLSPIHVAVFFSNAGVMTILEYFFLGGHRYMWQALRQDWHYMSKICSHKNFTKIWPICLLLYTENLSSLRVNLVDYT